jgi:hypothetical protein
MTANGQKSQAATAAAHILKCQIGGKPKCASDGVVDMLHGSMAESM